MKNERRLIPITKVKKERLRWLWRDRIAMGYLTSLEGDPAQGKSTVTYDLIARVTAGMSMPVCTRAMSPAGAVLIQGEDSVGTVVKPALQAAGADMQRVRVYDRRRFQHQPLLLPQDVSLIAEAAREVGAKLIVIDPLTAFVAGPATSERAVRQALGPLAALAEREQLAVVLCRHLTKAGSANPLYRGLGSVAISAFARSSLMVIDDPSTDAAYQHLLIQTKANLSSAETLRYRTVKKDGCNIIEWRGTSTYTAKQLAGSAGSDRSALREAMQVLYEILKDGPETSSHVIAKAKVCEIAVRTLRRAKAALDIRSHRVEGYLGWLWEWHLPEKENDLLRAIREQCESAEKVSAKHLQAISS